MTREEYLTKAAHKILSDIITKSVRALEYDYPVPTFRVSVGYAPGWRAGARRKTMAVCFKKKVSKGGVNEIFVTPENDDVIRVLADLAHELIHAYDDCESGHQGFFAHVARHIGLEGKLTSTHAGAELTADLRRIADELGPYPHRAMQVKGIKKDGTRQLKVSCDDCGMIFRTSRKWMDHVVACPCCGSEALDKE